MAWFAARRFLILSLAFATVAGSPRRIDGRRSLSPVPLSDDKEIGDLFAEVLEGDVPDVETIEEMAVTGALADEVERIAVEDALEDVLGLIIRETDTEPDRGEGARRQRQFEEEGLDDQLKQLFSGQGVGPIRSSYGAFASAPYGGTTNIYQSLYPSVNTPVAGENGEEKTLVKGGEEYTVLKPYSNEAKEEKDIVGLSEWEGEEATEAEEKSQKEDVPNLAQTDEMFDNAKDIVEHIDDNASDNLNDDFPIQEMMSMLEDDLAKGADADGEQQVIVEPEVDGGVSITKVKDTEKEYALDADESDEVLPESLADTVVDDDSTVKVHEDQVDMSVMDVSNMGDVPVGEDVDTEGKEVHKDDIKLSLVSVDPNATDDVGDGDEWKLQSDDENTINVRKEDINLSVVSVDDGSDDACGDESVNKDDSVKVNIVQVGDVSTYNVEQKSVNKDDDGFDTSSTTQIDTVEQNGEIKDGSDRHDKVIEHETVSSEDGEETSVKKTRSEEQSAERSVDEDDDEFHENVDDVMTPEIEDDGDSEYESESDGESDLETEFDKEKKAKSVSAEIGNSTKSQMPANTGVGYGGNSTTTGYGSYPSASYYGGNTTAAAYGSKTISADYGGNPTTAGYGGISIASGYGGNTTAAAYGSKTISDDYGGNPTVARYGGVTASGYGGNTTAAAYGGNPVQAKQGSGATKGVTMQSEGWESSSSEGAEAREKRMDTLISSLF